MQDNWHDLCMNIHWMQVKITYPGWTDIRQNLGFHSFYWIHEGKGIFQTETDIRVKAGMLFYLQPGLKLTMESDSQFPLRISMVLLSLFKGTVHLQQAEFISSVTALPLPFLLQSEGDVAKEYDLLFRSLLQSWVPGQPESELLTKALLYQLLYQMHQQTKLGESGGSSLLKLFENLKDELERSYGTEIRLQELAERHNISSSYMRSLFQKHLGQSPKSYLSRLRNEHAKKQLIFTDYPMKTIADNCGYADEFHFSKSFKQLNGLPPKSWRESYTNT